MNWASIVPDLLSFTARSFWVGNDFQFFQRCKSSQTMLVRSPQRRRSVDFPSVVFHPLKSRPVSECRSKTRLKREDDTRALRGSPARHELIVRLAESVAFGSVEELKRENKLMLTASLLLARCARVLRAGRLLLANPGSFRQVKTQTCLFPNCLIAFMQMVCFKYFL